ncbi:MAG: bifunctional 5,10-methylenetetrahydrofolate dehydrogenase/5,10-methenyltetrahydrofolate cyclohydrolase [Alphaproteobacteria bacterium]|nr:bifunctional 5,10-methylenetetrahydrofolate dehydrogenase/5,10-methenyltetrahydrofolate cyclohydrolase [Alphaproteobacteria bacterium]OJV13495.1 MAG: hypothetical protein BGO27_04735 [Alphaproteobacteria bacterium 33-17]
MTNIIDCIGLAKKFNDQSCEIVARLKDSAIFPKLSVLLIGDNPASTIYVNNKVKKCHELGIESSVHTLSINATQEEVESLIDTLNNDNKVHGILVQLPLPNHLDSFRITQKVSPEKDVDGFTLQNVGLLSYNKATLIPCTPLGITKILDSLNLDLTGKKVAVIGRSNIVGRPLVNLLINKDFTVVCLHSKSLNLEEELKTADIVIPAIGSPEFIKGHMIKEGSIVIDVGISKVNNGIVGDCHFESCSQKASYITTVPKGVGPLTIAMLMQNTLKATCIQNGLWFDEFDN